MLMYMYTEFVSMALLAINIVLYVHQIMTYVLCYKSFTFLLEIFLKIILSLAN